MRECRNSDHGGDIDIMVESVKKMQSENESTYTHPHMQNISASTEGLMKDR